MATNYFHFEFFVRNLRREFSTFLDEGFIMDLENNWYEGRYRTQILASLICKKIPDDRLKCWVRNGVEEIQRAPFVSRSRPKYCESKWESPAVKLTCGSSKEAYSETAITETDVVTFQYYVNVLERGIRNYSESDMTIVLSGCPNRNFLEKGLNTIARSAKVLVKEMKARDTIIWMCLEWYMDTLEGILERDINLDEDIPFLPYEEILGEDELDMFKATYRMLVKLRNHLGNRDNERIMELYQQKLNRAILELSNAEDDNRQLRNSADAVHRHLLVYDQRLKLLQCVEQDLNKRVDDEHRQVLEYGQQLRVLKREKQDLVKSNYKFETKFIDIKQELGQTKSELNKAMEKVNSLQNENKENENEMRDNQNELKKTKANLRRTEEKNNRLQKELNDAREETKEVRKSLSCVQNEIETGNESNSKFMQEAHQYKQERERVTEELRKKEETLSSAEERIERLERNVEDEQRQSVNAKSELQHTIGINEDLQTKLTNAQKKISQLKDTLSRFQKDTRTEDESILKLRQEAERYKQERDIVKEELQKANEKTISSQKGIAHLQKNLKEQNIQLDSVELELRQTREKNKDLQNRLENAQKETNELKESFSRVRKETRTEDESGSNLRGEAERYKQEMDYVKEELRKAKEKTNSSRERIAQLEQKLEEQHRQLANVNSELRQTQEKNEDLQNRFSQDTAAQLTHENPSIAELSDVNRPTKLAERLFELYENEWTDAFTAIEEEDPRNVASEEDIAKKLKDILRNCFEECVDISNQQLANIEATLLNPGSGKHTSASRQLTPKQAMTITDLRRETSILSTEHIKQKMCRRFHDSTKLKDLKLFIEKCSELCWLMAVQSPPVDIEDRHRPGGRFNGDVFKAYTKSGKVIEYVVWPPVYLHKGGPLLCKGIAQGKE